MNDKRKILFLGTSAADFSPLLKTRFSRCFDKNARRSSCLLLNDWFLIDCGPHCMESLSIAGADVGRITDLFLTHTHADHFCAQHAEELARGKSRPLNIWCRRDCVLPEIPNTRIIRMEFGREYSAAENLSVFAVDANHDEYSFPQHYIFQLGGKKIMYATDGSWFLTRSYNRLKNIHLDLLILDATCGETVGEYRIAEHNTLPMIRLFLPSLKTVGIVDDNTKVYLTHIAPSLHRPHDAIQASVQADGMTVAFDGLEILL